MNNGIVQFKKYFKDFADNYTLIGGMACYLIMNEAGIDFRATKDFDMVLSIEALDDKFVKKFWKFIEDGQYQIKQKSDGKPQFYRFMNPIDKTFPTMIELFSIKPAHLTIEIDSHLTPIPVTEKLSSLSAILLDEDYYNCLKSGTRIVDDINILNPEYILAFKAKAWLDLSERKELGVHIDSKQIKKHLNDIFRLFSLLAPSDKITLPTSIKNDLTKFLIQLRKNNSINLRQLGINNLSKTQVIESIEKIYQIL